MELKLLNSISLANQLTTNFAANWSKDGSLFVITDKTVSILKLISNVANTENSFTFMKSEISVGDYHVANHTGINIADAIPDLDRSKLYHSILNYNMTPELSEASPVPIRPISACWSPPVRNGNKSQLLAIVSNAGNVEIFKLERNNWKILVNVTEKWIEHLKSTWNEIESELENETRFEFHKERITQSIATSVCWSDILKENNSIYYYIIIGHADGCLSVWKLIHSETDSESIHFVNSFQTNLQLITSLNWCNATDTLSWIIIGDIDGIIKALPISARHFKTEQLIDVWTDKDIRVGNVLSISHENNCWFLITKGSYIILSIINHSKVIEHTKFFNFDNINITGLQQVKGNRFMISTYTGVLKILTITPVDDDIEYRIDPVITDMKWGFHSCHGLVKSPQGTIWGVLMHPCKMFDHLILRNPITISFCTSVKFDPGKYLRTNPICSLQNVWEALEIIRCEAVNNNTLPCSWLAKIENYIDITSYELRIFLRISLICEAFILKRNKCRKLESSLISSEMLKRIIFFKFHLQKLNDLLDLYESGESLSSFQNQSLYLLYDAVKSFRNDPNYKQYLNDNAEMEFNVITERIQMVASLEIPMCLWCGENLTSNSCPSNHLDQRCAFSGVQIQGVAKWECVQCDLTASHHIQETDDLCCPLCDLPMLNVTYD